MFRLQDLQKKLETSDTIDFSDLSFKLAYSDQAHMIRDFKNILGVTPSEFITKIKGDET